MGLFKEFFGQNRTRECVLDALRTTLCVIPDRLMLFHSFAFFVLFTVTFVVYWSIKDHRIRLISLIVASIVFYAHWNSLLVLLILFSALFDFQMARWIEASQSPFRRKALLTVSICTSLGLLAYFKYTGFLINAVYSVAHSLGIESSAPVFQVVLPLGISFYTFETISYVVDVYQGTNQG